MLRVSITVSELCFMSGKGNSLTCSPNDIVIFVGSNNSGKTTCLKEIIKFAIKPNGSFIPKFFEEVKFHKPNTSAEVESFIKEYATMDATHIGQYHFNGLSLNINHFASLWARNGYFPEIGQYFIHELKTEDRLTITSRSNNKIDYTRQQPTTPLQKIDSDDKLADSVSNVFSKIFYKDLVIDKHSGVNIVLRVGTKPDYTKENDRQSNEYRDKIRLLPLLEEQGDGMKSAAGIILELWTAPLRTILIIDEPEAFLHPPQAREIGNIIANERPQGQQLFLATHDSDFLKGILEAKNSNIHIIRVIRDNEDNTEIKVLKNNDLKTLLSDSWLKHSNFLDSIFYQETILCEADADSRFYKSVLDACDWQRNKPETFFLPCGGKERFKKAIIHLMKLGVKPKIIADIDIIFGNGKSDNTKIIFEILGWQLQ